MSEGDKILMNVVRNFDAQFDDEVSVGSGSVVQFVRKLDRMWFKVYHDGREGKIPINTCQEWSPTDMAKLAFDPDNGQAAFVAKFDFIRDAQEGDLVFTANELLIGELLLFIIFLLFCYRFLNCCFFLTTQGLYLTNESWWYGTRLKSVIWKNNCFLVKPENCGIFPITHVWMLRTDLLPDTVLSSRISIESEDYSSLNSERELSNENNPSSNYSSAKSSLEDYSKPNPNPDEPEQNQSILEKNV